MKQNVEYFDISQKSNNYKNVMLQKWFLVYLEIAFDQFETNLVYF